MKKLIICFILILYISDLRAQKSAGVMVRGGIFAQSDDREGAGTFDLTFQANRKDGGIIGIGAGFISADESNVIPVYLQLGYMGRQKKINPAFTGNFGMGVMNKAASYQGWAGSYKGGFYSNIMAGAQFRADKKSGFLVMIGYTILNYKFVVRGVTQAGENEFKLKNNGFTAMVGFKIN